MKGRAYKQRFSPGAISPGQTSEGGRRRSRGGAGIPSYGKPRMGRAVLYVLPFADFKSSNCGGTRLKIGSEAAAGCQGGK